MDNEMQMSEVRVEVAEKAKSSQKNIQSQQKPLRALKWLTVIVSFFAVGLSMAQNPEHVERTTLEGAMMALGLVFIIFAVKGHNGLRRSETWHCYLFSDMRDLLLGIPMTVLNILSVLVMVLVAVNIQQGDGWEGLVVIVAAYVFYWTLKYHWVALSRISQNDEFSVHGYVNTNPPTWLLYGRVYLLFKGLALAVACSATAQSMMTALRKAGSRATVRVKEALEMDWKAVRLYGRTATIQDVLFNALVLNIVLAFCKRVWEDVLLRTKETESQGFAWFSAYTYVGVNLVSLGLVVGCIVTAFGIYGKAVEDKQGAPAVPFAAAPADIETDTPETLTYRLSEERADDIVRYFVHTHIRSNMSMYDSEKNFAKEVDLPNKGTRVSREEILASFTQFFSLFRDIKVKDVQVGICDQKLQMTFRARVRNSNLDEDYLYGCYTFETNSDGLIIAMRADIDQVPMKLSDEYVPIPYEEY